MNHFELHQQWHLENTHRDTFLDGSAAKTLSNFTPSYGNGSSRCGDAGVGDGGYAAPTPECNGGDAHNTDGHGVDAEEPAAVLLLQWPAC